VPLDMQRRLRRFGLYELRDIAKLPVGKLQAQFGPHGRRAWELANGLDREPVRAVVHEERVVERLTMPSPSVQIESVLIGVDQLVQRVFNRKEVRGRGARQVRLQLILEEQRSWDRTFSLKGAVGEPEDLYRILRFRLAGLTLDGAVESIVLELIGLTAVYARQEQLFDEQGLKRRQRRSIGEASRQLKQRYGATPLYRIGPLEPWSRIPERRWALFGWEG
jgi:DNA polymerase-4/protein ImuB